MQNQSAEEFLVNSQNKEILYENIFIKIPHGRLNHWLHVFKTLYILFRRIGIKAHPFDFPEYAFKKELCTIMNNSLSKKKETYPNYPIFVSCMEDFFSSKMEPLRLSIKKNNLYKNHEEFSMFFKPIGKYFTKKETINNLSKKIKIDASTFLSRKKISIHLRRGDLAVLEKKKYLDSPIGAFFESEYFIYPYGFISNSEFLLAKTKEHTPFTKPPKLFHLQKPINYYMKLIQDKIKEGYLVFLFSDGFTIIANQFKEKTKCNYSPKEIETLINKIEFPFEKDPNLIVSYGEEIKDVVERKPFLDFNDLLCIAYNADFVVSKESKFPSTFLEILKS